MQQFAKFHLDYKPSRPLLEAARWLHPSRTRTQSLVTDIIHPTRETHRHTGGDSRPPLLSASVHRLSRGSCWHSGTLPVFLPHCSGHSIPRYSRRHEARVGSIRGRSCWCNPLAPSTAHHLEGFCLFRKPELFTRCTVEDSNYISVFIIYLVDDIL